MEINTFLMMGPPGSGKGLKANCLQIKSVRNCTRPASDAENSLLMIRILVGDKRSDRECDLMPDWFSIYLFEDKMITLQPQNKIVFDGSGRKVHEAQLFMRCQSG